MDLTTIVFSKNRACQLELLLRSLGDLPASVLYTYDSGFEAGYKKVINMYPSINFIKQYDFKSQLINFVKNSKYVYFPTDDIVFIDYFSENSKEFREFIKSSDIISLSLGLSPNIAGKKWRWQDFKGNYKLRMWGYPVSIDSCILRAEDVLPAIIDYGDMPTPNYFEMALLAKTPTRPYMMCFDHPKIINNSVNQVQKDFPAHTVGISPEILENNFLKGKRLSLTDIKEKARGAVGYRIKETFIYE